MTTFPKPISVISFLTAFWLLTSLCPPNVSESLADPSFPEKSAAVSDIQLTPAQQYSGELLAYLLKVVLGRAGQPQSRDPWRVRAIDETLDFENIVKTMTDSEKNRLDFMVLDPDILDLSQVLFHYDEKLSLYKGDYGVTSVYPAPEILALRLFILKKINARKRINVDALIERKGILLDKDHPVSAEDLSATGLSARELKFLRDIFQSEPTFYSYLTAPFLLKELKETEVLTPGSVTEKIIQSARYTPLRCEPMGRPGPKSAIRIAFLPSMTKEFVYGKEHPSLSEHGFKPTEFLDEIFSKLKNQILEKTRENLKRTITEPPHNQPTEPQWHALWQQISQKKIAFCMEKKRPLVIYPENAAQVIHEVCPEADLTIILMGKNIYRAIFFDPARDVYPFVNRIYLDIMDVEYDQVGEEIEIISQFICSRLKTWVTRRVCP